MCWCTCVCIYLFIEIVNSYEWYSYVYGGIALLCRDKRYCQLTFIYLIIKVFEYVEIGKATAAKVWPIKSNV